jgi:ketosteroid isomerase-like protein
MYAGASAASRSTPRACVLSVRNGAVTELRYFTEPAEALKAVGVAEETMSRQNVEKAKLGFELWNASLSEADGVRRSQAIARLKAAYHPEATIDFTRTTPDLWSTAGPDAMLTWMEGTRGLFDEVQIEATDFIDAGDTVLVATRITATGSTSGAPVQFEYAYVFRYNTAGEVISAVSYPTMAEAREGVGPVE